MWEEWLKQMLGLLGGFAILVAALVWLTKKILSHWLTKDIEAHKVKLKAERDIALEKLKNELKILTIEHEIKFRSIHEKQAEVIAETYALLTDVHRKVASYVAMLEYAGEPSKEEKFEMVRESYEKFRDFYFPRELYFSTETAKKVKDLSNRLAGIASDFTRGIQRSQMPHQPREKVGEDYWSKAEEAVRNEIPPLLDSMSAEFRKILGVKDESGADNGEEETDEEAGQGREPEAQG